ncbi:MAG: hypothetical protein FWC09_03410 [Lachnospiraceae bacterium]|nr:hypothetical protein [Lachnospiraceae bacterium]
MSIAQQVSTIIEQLPNNDQIFIFELIKRLSNNKEAKEINSMNTGGNIKALKDFMKACEADPLTADPIDEMLITERVNIARELNL